MFAPENKWILLVEPDEITLGLIDAILTELGYQVTPCRTPADAMSLASSREFDLALIGMELPGTTPLELVKGLRRRKGGLPAVLLTGVESIRRAIEFLHQGIDDYLLLPPDAAEVRLRVGRILEGRELDSTMVLLRNEIVRKTATHELVEHSPAMRAVVEKARKIAPMKSTVLILGESGVGKELVARSIHYASPRHDQPFVAINCSAIPESLIESEIFGHERGAFTGAVARTQGKFELANRGTLFLDEIGEMTPSAQVKLLRVLEEREFMRVGGSQSIKIDVRVLAATNADLERLVEEGGFRRDLYFRLKVVTLAVPPLRERREDLPILVPQLVDQISRANNLPARRTTERALEAFLNYHWPGNVRELQNLIENLLVSTTGDVIDLEDLPPAVQGIAPIAAQSRDPRGGSARAGYTPVFTPDSTMEEMERELIRKSLERAGGNRTRTAKTLKIGVRTLQRKIARYGLT